MTPDHRVIIEEEGVITLNAAHLGDLNVLHVEDLDAGRRLGLGHVIPGFIGHHLLAVGGPRQGGGVAVERELRHDGQRGVRLRGDLGGLPSEQARRGERGQTEGAELHPLTSDLV